MADDTPTRGSGPDRTTKMELLALQCDDCLSRWLVTSLARDRSRVCLFCGGKRIRLIKRTP